MFTFSMSSVFSLRYAPLAIGALLMASTGCVTIEDPGYADSRSGGGSFGDDDDDDDDWTGDDDDDDANNIGSIGDCAGYYAGNYAGALNGGVDGYLNQDGSLELEFYVEGDVMYGSGQTSSSGAIVGSSSGLIAIDGELDFSDCTATGSWSSNYAGSGSWTVFPD
ncbi:MAG: hypothetical protein HN348_27950 [Proteobacteria bacterium]|nr:hypothetical protein [Pseudomonadota bacterium]